MKKRILALALAGTTAFSVFGAAMSASAIQQTAEATVTLKDGKVVYYYTDDAYLPYDNVAKTISTTAFAAASSTHTYYDVTTGTGKVVADEDPETRTPSVAEYNKTIAKKDDYTPYLYTISKDGSYLNYDKDGNLYAIATYGAKAEKITEAAAIVAAVAPFGIAPTAPQENSNEKWVIADKNNATYKTLAEAISDAASLTGVTKNTDAKHVLLNDEVEVLKAGDDHTAADYSANNIEDAVFNKLPDNDAAYKESNIKVLESTVVAGSGANAMVVVNHGNKLNGAIASAAYDEEGKDIAGSVASQTGWVFTSQDTSAEITPYTLDSQSYLNSDKSGYYIVTTAVDNNTVYAYDFVPAANGNVANASAGSIAWNWNYGTVTATAATFGNAWVAEDGRGTPGIGVRYGVVSDWLDFLDELGINHDGTDHYVEDFEEFKDNYWDLFYLDNVYSEKTGLLKGYEYVDLYNIQELLHDIYEYSYKSEWSKANTSELVYLMQQYNKYIGDYISTAEVANDDWGDLLLSILDAATEADFKNAKEYKKYTNKVTSLRDAYEEATTTAQIYRAEADMYDLLTNYGAYGYTAKGDFSDARKELGAAINGLYFNATTKSSTGNVIPTYTTEAATWDKTYAKYSNYEYLVAASKTAYDDGHINEGPSIVFSVTNAHVR